MDAPEPITLATIRERIPEPAKDLRLNLDAVLGDASSLRTPLRHATALACALGLGDTVLSAALRASLHPEIDAALLDDARAAAALMAMNNVFYRSRHMLGKETYAQKPARLRMQRIAKPVGAKAEFELLCLAVSAVNGCEACLRAHERAVLEAGLTEDHVFDAIRVAAVVRGASVALHV